jgi:hypothetical protein
VTTASAGIGSIRPFARYKTQEQVFHRSIRPIRRFQFVVRRAEFEKLIQQVNINVAMLGGGPGLEVRQEKAVRGFVHRGHASQPVAMVFTANIEPMDCLHLPGPSPAAVASR